MIQLDTSFLIQSLISGTLAEQRVAEWIASGQPLAISVLVWSEFLCGPVSKPDVDAALVLFPEVVPFSRQAAAVAADLYNSTGRRRGSMLGCMIAATAIEAGAVFATENVRDFMRFLPLGLRLAETAES